MSWRSLIWLLFCAVSGAVLVAYIIASVAAGRGELMMPLDDTYIHFQYAKQLARGQPFIYNPGEAATSGATSLLYPVILSIGYFGLKGLNLALWAMGVGALALLGSLWTIYHLAKAFDAPEWIAILASMAFALTGAVAWHFMSGMETGLMILLVLTTLYTVVTQRFRGFIVSASLLALMRPEGGVLAVLAVGVMLLQANAERTRYIASLPHTGEMDLQRATHESPLQTWRVLWLVIPVLMLGVQPLVNQIFTGSAVATGNSVKSIFATVPFYWGDVLRRILENFTRMWAEWFTGVSPREGEYVWIGYSLLAIVGMISLLVRRERRWIGVLIVLWLLAGSASISTLETAFWHFKRYQVPLMALFFPLAAWGGVWLYDFIPKFYDPPRRIILMLSLLVVLRDSSASVFWRHFALNGHYVYSQPYQMARWLQANTPEDAVVAVHDVGMMRYIGDRTTLDMVGLTTPGAAAYWRNGPGSVAEFLIQERPDYIASYGHGHGYGLGMIADTSIYGEPLASFRVTLDPNYNVALAADVQGIYQPDWLDGDYVYPSLAERFGFNYWTEGSHLPNGHINVGDVQDEVRADYHWKNNTHLSGFATEFYEFNYVGCLLNSCRVRDAGRLITGEEVFDMDTWIGSDVDLDVVLITRIHPAFAGSFDVYANDVLVDTQWIPAIPGQWLEIATFIPKEVATDPTHFRIVPHMPNGYYMPFYHWALTMPFPQPQPENTIGQFQDGNIILATREIGDLLDNGQLPLNLNWYTYGSAQGDYKLFVHILDQNGQIVQQVDRYPGNGTLPPGNWLPGLMVRDTIMVNLAEVPSGTYRVAIGLYDPYTFERLEPQSVEYEVSDGRLFIGEIEVE